MEYAYRSEMHAYAINSDLTQLDDVSLMNLRLAWQSSDENWRAVLAVTNLTDEFHYESQVGTGGVPDFSVVRRPGWPRQTVFTLRRSF